MSNPATVPHALGKYHRAFWVSQYFQKSCFPTMAFCIFCDMSQFTTPPPLAQIRSIPAPGCVWQKSKEIPDFTKCRHDLPDNLRLLHIGLGTFRERKICIENFVLKNFVLKNTPK